MVLNQKSPQKFIYLLYLKVGVSHKETCMKRQIIITSLACLLLSPMAYATDTVLFEVDFPNNSPEVPIMVNAVSAGDEYAPPSSINCPNLPNRYINPYDNRHPVSGCSVTMNNKAYDSDVAIIFNAYLAGTNILIAQVLVGDPPIGNLYTKVLGGDSNSGYQVTNSYMSGDTAVVVVTPTSQGSKPQPQP
jgi:hypothetical protein